MHDVQEAIWAWRDGIGDGDVQALSEQLCDDAEWVEPGMESSAGTQARQAIAHFWGRRTLEPHGFLRSDIDVSGDFAIRRYVRDCV